VPINIQDLRVEVESKSATEVLKSLVPRVFGNESSSSKSSNKDKDKHDERNLDKGCLI
jgi:hypothetical protein